jgi:hypothetical protein
MPSDTPDVVAPPVVPKHPLRLLNWSRLARRRSKLFWFLALPFTLVNVAGYMTPEPSGPLSRLAALWLRISVICAGLLLTISAQIWLVAIAETIGRDVTWQLLTPTTLVIVPSAILAFGILLRWAWPRDREGTSRIFALSALLSVVAIAGITTAVLAFPPAGLVPNVEGWDVFKMYRPTSADARETFGLFHPAAICAALQDAPHAVEVRWDTMNVFIVASSLAVLLFPVGLLLLSFLLPAAQGTPVAGAALLLTTSIFVLHSLASALRLSVELALDYLSYLAIPGVWDQHGVTPWERLFIPYQMQGACTFGSRLMDGMPTLSVLGGIAFCLAMILVNPDLGAPGRRGYPRRALYLHALVGRLGTKRLPLACLLTDFLWCGFIACWFFFGDVRVFQVIDRSAVHLLALTVFLYVVLNGRILWLREIVGYVGDVVSFWPIHWHPLAGWSYRRAVMQGLNEAVTQASAETVVIVGHSQGSVVGAWFAACFKEPSTRLSLVTCGSPIQSLYRSFFPSHTKRLSTVSVPWLNYWRETDPIATAVDGAVNIRLADPVDPRANPRPQGHTNYWTDPEQLMGTTALVKDAVSPKSDNPKGQLHYDEYAERFKAKAASASTTR